MVQDGKVVKKTGLIDPKLSDWEEASETPHPFDVNVVIKWSQIKVESKLGNGAFGEVKKANYRGTPVAVKMLHNSDAAQSFFQEASLLCSLRHPNIVACLGVCVVEPNLAIVMELMASNLTQMLRNGALPTAKIVELAIGITRGILFLHNRDPKVIHRDIKPENILIDSGGTPKLADFGVSKESLETMTQTKIGTPIYAAPELLNGDAYGTAIDIYSLSMVFYAMATGVTPFSDLKNGSRPHTPAQIMMKAAVKRERPIIPASVHPTLAAIIRDCWDHFPKKRPTAEQLLDRLISFNSELNAATKSSTPTFKTELVSLEPTVPMLSNAPTLPLAPYESLTTHADFDWMGENDDSIPLEKRPPKAGSSSSVLDPASMPTHPLDQSLSTAAQTKLTASSAPTRKLASTALIDDEETSNASEPTPSQVFRGGRTLRSATKAAASTKKDAADSLSKASSGATMALNDLKVSKTSKMEAHSTSKPRTRAAASKSRATSSRNNIDTSSTSTATNSFSEHSEVPEIDEDVEKLIQEAPKRKSKRNSPSSNIEADSELTSGAAARKKLLYQIQLEEGRRPSAYLHEQDVDIQL